MEIPFTMPFVGYNPNRNHPRYHEDKQVDGADETVELYAIALQEGGLSRLAKTIAEDVDSWLAEHALATSSEGGVSYHTWLEYFDFPMRAPASLVICTEQLSVSDELDGNPEWEDYLAEAGFEYELWDSTIMLLCPEDEALQGKVLAEFAFEWHARLVAPDYAAIYASVYSYFARNGERMKELHWREFEKFLASVFSAQGYETILGPGQADGGVDLRLTCNAVYGDQVTVVQAKRWSESPIGLEQVAALSGVMYDQDAERGIFVTTSRFLPVAQRFAARQQRKIQLTTSDDVAIWCDAIASKRSPSTRLGAAIRSFDIDPSKILCAQKGYTTTNNIFAYIVTESATAVRLAKLPTVEPPEYRSADGWQGYSIPDLGRGLGAETPVFTARRKSKSFGEGEFFWGDDGCYYESWDRQPKWYNHLD
jgi:Restriction endonuclease